jgi:hypothetical protein
MAFKIDDDCVDVAHRITLFYERYPDGRLTRVGEPKVWEIGGKSFIGYTAHAYRTPDDPVPAVGTAWEPFPGPTQFTRDSELMNAETSAWGRAIIAAGIPSKKIASSDEVKARTSPKVQEPEPVSDIPTEAPKPIGDAAAAEIILNSDSAGIPRDDLRKAAWYAKGQPEPPLLGLQEGMFEDDRIAIDTLKMFDPSQRDRLNRWMDGKRAKLAESQDLRAEGMTDEAMRGVS